MHQPPHGYVFGHARNYSGPPPAKRAKSNPIITRYPPPPGYRGPAQPQHTSSGYGHPQVGSVGYPPQPYAAAQPHAQAYPQTYVQPYQQPAHSGYPQHPYAAGQILQQGYPTHPNPYQQPLQQAWPGAPPQPDRRRSHPAALQRNGRKSSLGPVDGNGDPLPPLAADVSGVEQLESEFDEECYFARHPEEVDPRFSLGLIEWLPAVPTKRALLPVSDEEAEQIWRRVPDTDESISIYHTGDRIDESFVSVRQLEHWEEVKNDVIYREFPKICSDIIPMAQMVLQYRSRPNPAWDNPPDLSCASSSCQDSRQPTPCEPHPHGHKRTYSQASSTAQDPLSTLEAAILANSEPEAAPPHGLKRKHSRASSIASNASHTDAHGEKLTRPVPLQPIRDQAQEDVLAMLGVTGSPKLVYQTPGPAFGPAAPANGTGRQRCHSRQGSASSLNGGAAAWEGGMDVDATPKPSMKMAGKRGLEALVEDGEGEETPRPGKVVRY